MTALEPGHDWSTHEAADPRDTTFADALQDPPSDPTAALVGVPYDGAVLGRHGARDGPEAVRDALASLKPHRFTAETTTLSVADAGDVPVAADAPVAEAHEATREAAASLREAGRVPVAVGGDHSLTYPLARPHADAWDALGVVNVDAHLDVREHDAAPNSGTSFGRLLRDGHVDGEHLAEVGVRDLATSPYYAGWAEDQGVTLVPARRVRGRDPRDIAESLYRGPLEDVDAVYVSLDVDALDQAHGPGVSAPTPGGLTSGTFADLAEALVQEAPAPVAGVDLVETAPRHDEGDRTARAAAYALARVLAALPEARTP